MSVAGQNYQPRFGTGAERIRSPRRWQRPKIDRKKVTLFILIFGPVAALFIALKIAPLFFEKTPAEAPVAQGATTSTATAAPIAAAPSPANLDTAWTTLEPAYRTYKVSIGEDSSLKINGRPAQLYGFRVIPRSKICLYGNGERWACGQRAYVALINLMGATTIDCQERNRGAPVDIDNPRSYQCRLPGTDLAELLLTEGWGTTPPDEVDARYLNAANAARLMKAGMWRTQAPAS